MSKVMITESYLEDIADAIRAKTGTQDTFTPAEMADAIGDIGGSATLGTKSISSNGTYNASSDSLDGYSSVTVNVPNPSTGTKQVSINTNGTTTENVTNYASVQIAVAVPNSYSSSDEGKVVSNGALVSQTSDTVTANGTVDTTLIDSLAVNVPGGAVTLASGTVTGGAQTLSIPVGTRMAQKDFIAIVTAPNNTTLAYNTTYKNVIAGFLCDGTTASFDLSQDVTDKTPTSKYSYIVDNSGTTTTLTPDSVFGSAWSVRNASLSQGSTQNGYVKITRSSSGFTLKVRAGAGTWQSDITYSYKVIYYGTDPGNDIVTVS